MNVQEYVEEYKKAASDNVRRRLVQDAQRNLSEAGFQQLASELGFIDQTGQVALPDFITEQPAGETTPQEDAVGAWERLTAENEALQQATEAQAADQSQPTGFWQELSAAGEISRAREIEAARRLEEQRARKTKPQDAMDAYDELAATYRGFQRLAGYQFDVETSKAIVKSFEDEPQSLNDFIDQLEADNYTPQTIQSFLASRVQGTVYSPLPVEVPTEVSARRVRRTEMGLADDPNDPYMITTMAGLVDEDGVFMRDQNGNIMQAYDTRQVKEMLYSQMSATERETLVDRLISLGFMSEQEYSPMVVEQAVTNLLANANINGYRYETLLDMMERNVGLDNGRNQAVLAPASSGGGYGMMLQEAAVASLGRKLTPIEERQILNRYQQERTQRPMQFRTGQPDASGRIYSMETVMDDWFKENKPDQYKLGKQMGHWDALWSLYESGGLSE